MVRDRRILRAVVSAASDAAASQEVREAALVVMASYTDPSVVGFREHPERERAEERYTLVQSPHATQRAGSEAVGATGVGLITEHFVRLASSATNPRIATLAAFLGDAVRR